MIDYIRQKCTIVENEDAKKEEIKKQNNVIV